MRSLFVAFAIALIIPWSAGCDSRGVSASAKPVPLRMILVDKLTDDPVPGVRVSVRPFSGAALSLQSSDSTGRVSWSRGISGRAEVVAIDPEGRFVQSRSEIDGSGDLRLELLRGSAISLNVTGEDGVELGASLMVWSADQPRGLVVRAVALDRPEGSPQVQIGPLASGPVKIFISADGYETKTIDLALSEKHLEMGDVSLRRGGVRLTGKVSLDLDVRPTEACYQFAGAELSVQVAADGSFQFRGLPPSSGTLVLRRQGRDLFSRTVRVQAAAVNLGELRPER